MNARQINGKLREKGILSRAGGSASGYAARVRKGERS